MIVRMKGELMDEEKEEKKQKKTKNEKKKIEKNHLPAQESDFK